MLAISISAYWYSSPIIKLLRVGVVDGSAPDASRENARGSFYGKKEEGDSREAQRGMAMHYGCTLILEASLLVLVDVHVASPDERRFFMLRSFHAKSLRREPEPKEERK